MSVGKQLFYSIFISLLFLGILVISGFSNISSVTLYALTLVVYTPILLSGLWLGLFSFVPLVVLTTVLTYFDMASGLSIFIFFIIPVFLSTVLTIKLKQPSAGSIISFISYYIVFIFVALISYYLYENPNIVVNKFIYDNLMFFSIATNNSFQNMFNDISNLDKKLDIISFITPTVLSFFFIIWFIINYRLSLFLANTGSIIKSSPIINRFYLPKLHTIVFISLLISTLFAHKILASNVNIHYILYNVLFILCFGYFYVGFCFVSNLIKQKNSIGLLLLFILLFVILFLELAVVFCLVGFILEIRRLAFSSLKK